MFLVQYRRSYNATPEEVSDEPPAFVIHFDNSKSLRSDATTRKIKTEAARTAVGVIFAEVVKSQFAPVTPLTFNIRLKTKIFIQFKLI